MNLLQQYGIKEVCDVTFYEIASDGKPAKPVLKLDTLKTSSVETTAESTSAKGGQGNPELLIWDYGKEVSVNLEDALFTPKSLAMMLSAGKVKSATGNIIRTDRATWTASGKTPDWGNVVVDNVNDGKVVINGMQYSVVSPRYFLQDGTEVDAAGKEAKENGASKLGTATANAVVVGYATYQVATGEASVIEVSGNTFPGSYYITGDTFIRNATTGKDEPFQLVFTKAKVLSENTISMSADGDPTTLSMKLKLQRAADGTLMKLIPYNLSDGEEVSTNSATSLTTLA